MEKLAIEFKFKYSWRALYFSEWGKTKEVIPFLSTSFLPL